jgi:hypothetical protein
MRGRVHLHESSTLSQICGAQYTLQSSCEQFWRNIPHDCIQEWDHRAACSVVYAYGKLLDGKVVSPASDDLIALQHKIVAFHAPHWDGQGVGNAAWSFCKQGLLLGDAAVHLQEAAARTAATMNSQDVASTLWAFTSANAELGEAKGLLKSAAMRTLKKMNAHEVADTLSALASMKIKLRKAREPLLRAVVRVSKNMDAQDVANTMQALAIFGAQLGDAEKRMMQAVMRECHMMNAMRLRTTFGLSVK